MRVQVDRDACIGSGMCTTRAPQVFVLGEDEKALVLTEAVPEGLESAVEDAEACCPVEAITVSR